jgi:hypothetical protein
MEGGFSWLVLVAAFVAVTVLCGILSVRLLRAGSPAGRDVRAGDPERAADAE